MGADRRKRKENPNKIHTSKNLQKFSILYV